MAEWKKVIVNDATGVSLTGSFSGSSFTGDGSGLTGVSADSLASSLVDGNGIVDFTYNGSAGATVTVEADGSTLSVGVGGVKVADDGITETQLNTSVAGTGLSGGGGTALSVDYGSSTGNAVQGNTNITINGTANEIDIAETNAQALGGGPSYTLGLADSIAGDRTFQNDVTIAGDLIVTGTTTQLQVTNLNVEDQFILLNSSSSDPNSDGGIIVQTDASANGTALFYDDSANRWALAESSSVAWNATSATAHQYVVSVSQSAVAPTGDPSNFGTSDASRYGMMYVDTSDTTGGGLYIYLPS